MSILLSYLALASCQAQSPISLSLFEDNFIVREGEEKEIAPMRLPPPEKKLFAPYRKNNTFVVWDERGLSIRHNNRLKSTKFPALPTSPKAFTKAEIRENIKRIDQGEIGRDAAALSGSQRIANDVFFLVRWDDRKGKPWLEGLFKVDLASDRPTPEFVARARALSTSGGSIDQQLFIFDGKLSYIAARPDRWGMIQLDQKLKKLKFITYGYLLDDFRRSTNAGGLFVERSSYGTNVAGNLDFRSQNRTLFAEGQERLKFADAADPQYVIARGKDKTVLRSTVSGMEYRLPPSSATRRTKRGVIVWTPIVSPKKAWLLEPDRWRVLATWQADKR